jgi:hypothetical protein
MKVIEGLVFLGILGGLVWATVYWMRSFAQAHKAKGPKVWKVHFEPVLFLNGKRGTSFYAVRGRKRIHVGDSYSNEDFEDMHIQAENRANWLNANRSEEAD